MRLAVLASASICVLLAACGSSETAQHDQANVANQAAASTPAAPSADVPAMTMPSATPTKDEAVKIMHERHEAMEDLGKAMKTLHRELDASPPDINAIRAQTSTMAATAAKIPSLFPPGTGPDVGKTRAKPDIWKQQDLFIRRAKEYLAAAQAIDAAAKAGDVNKVMALHDGVDKACKACHDPFRAPKN
jgi:cytochrome c556